MVAYRPSGSPLGLGQAVDVEMIVPPIQPRRAARPAAMAPKRPNPAKTLRVEQRDAVGVQAGQPTQTNDQAASIPQPPPQALDGARLSAALRRSGIGCANPDATELSEGEREACRHRLAQGAASAPYISSVPPVKREYYAALQESEAAMARDPMGGHGPQIVCGPAQKQRLGLKFGPCKLAAPLSPWIPEADVRGP